MRLGYEANYGEVMVLIRKILREFPSEILDFIVKDLLLLDWKQRFSPSHNLRMLQTTRGSLAYSRKLQPDSLERMLSPPPKMVIRGPFLPFSQIFGGGERYMWDTDMVEDGKRNWGKIQGSYAHRLLRQTLTVDDLGWWHGFQ